MDLSVFKPQMTSRVIEDYSEVVNCARPPKAVCHKSSSSRTKSNSDSVKEKPDETPVPLGSYETVTMVSDSVVTSGVYPTVVHNYTVLYGLSHSHTLEVSYLNQLCSYVGSKANINIQHNDKNKIDCWLGMVVQSSDDITITLLFVESSILYS